MSALNIAFVTALTALATAIVAPLMSFLIARLQIRAAVVSANRERWIEALRDSIAEYVALVLTASMVRQAIEHDTVKAVSQDRDLRQIVERIVQVKHRILLMISPHERGYLDLCKKVEASYESLVSDNPWDLARTRSEIEAITQLGRNVLMAEWARVKRGS